MKKTVSAGVSFILLGFFFIFYQLETAHSYSIYYFLIAAGSLLLAVPYFAKAQQKNLLCSMSIHQYHQVPMSAKMQSAEFYKCERCGKEKQTIRAA